MKFKVIIKEKCIDGHMLSICFMSLIKYHLTMDTRGSREADGRIAGIIRKNRTRWNEIHIVVSPSRNGMAMET